MMNRRQLLTAFGTMAVLPTASAAVDKPNILFVLMDDLGYPTLGCFGNRLVPTPNLDRLATEGVRFTQAYATPQCTPTRATLLTGQYTARNRMWHVIPWYGYPKAAVQEPEYRENLDRDSFNLAKGLKSAGYATACIGKWHLTTNQDGSYNTLNPSASHYYGFDVTASPSKSRDEFSTGDKAVNRFTDEAIAFFTENSHRPWFCYLAHHSIHRKVAAPQALVKKYLDRGYPTEGLNNATYLAAIEHMDTAVGRLLTALDHSGQGERTVVVFLSDNGGIHRTYLPNPKMPAEGPLHLTEGIPDFDNAPLRAGKGSSYEGGIRVPMIVRWPGVTKAGVSCETPVHAVDLMPTFFAMAGARMPDGYVADGVNLAPLFDGKGKIAKRSLYWYMPFYDVRWLATPSAILRDGDYKFIDWFGDYIDESRGAELQIGAKMELFDLRKDPSEKNDLSRSKPDVAARMQRQLRGWIESTGAVVPRANPRYDRRDPLLEVTLAKRSEELMKRQ